MSEERILATTIMNVHLGSRVQANDGPMRPNKKCKTLVINILHSIA